MGNAKKGLHSFIKDTTKSDKEMFEEMDMSISDKKVLFEFVKKDTKLSIKSLVGLVLKDKINKEFTVSVKNELLLAGLINEDLEINESGKSYLELDETKERINSLIK